MAYFLWGGDLLYVNDEEKIGYYAVLPSKVLFNKELKANEKLLYAVITILANKEGYCYASNNYLADLFNSKAHTISNWISHLNKLGFVYVELIRNDNKEIIQRRIYINDIPYVKKMTYPYLIKMTEGMSQKRQDNNINIKIDRFFNYLIKNEKQNPENMTKDEEIGFKEILERFEFNYTEELIKFFTEDNIIKLKTITYALKDIYVSIRKHLITKLTRDELIDIYDKCKSKQNEYINTINEINNFYEYYYASLVRKIES